MDLWTLQSQVGQWSDHNFGSDPAHRLHPLLGMIEELGELALAMRGGHQLRDNADACICDLLLAQELLGRLTHYVLKGLQGIRGHGAEDVERLSLAADQLADFLTRLCGEYAVSRNFPGTDPTPYEISAARADAVGDIAIYMADFCCRNDIHLSDAVAETWFRVKQRNWVQFKTDGQTE